MMDKAEILEGQRAEIHIEVAELPKSGKSFSLKFSFKMPEVFDWYIDLSKNKVTPAERKLITPENAEKEGPYLNRQDLYSAQLIGKYESDKT